VSEKILESLATDDQTDFILLKLQQKERVEDILEQLSRRSLADGSSKFGPSSQSRHVSLASDRSDADIKSTAEYVPPGLDETNIDNFKRGS
jgi:hypothetical protein